MGKRREKRKGLQGGGRNNPLRILACDIVYSAIEISSVSKGERNSRVCLRGEICSKDQERGIYINE